MKEKYFMNGIFRETEEGPKPFYSTCKSCGAKFFPAELIVCNQCNSTDLEQDDLPTEGILETFTVNYRPVNMYKVPHTICVVNYPQARIKVKGMLELSDDYIAHMEKGHEVEIGSKVELFIDTLWEDPEEDTRYIGYKYRLKEEDK